jgi:hypothetical protein
MFWVSSGSAFIAVFGEFFCNGIIEFIGVARIYPLGELIEHIH